MSQDREIIAAAALKRLQELRFTSPLYKKFDEDHQRREKFRRLIDVGVLRPNSRSNAIKSLEVLLDLTKNILENKNDKKYHRFKTTNLKVKRFIMETPGVLQCCIELGFEEKAEDYQTYYVFKPKYMANLSVGASMIKEALDRERPKEEQERDALEKAKAEEIAHKVKIKKQFYDDRMTVANRNRTAIHTRTIIESSVSGGLKHGKVHTLSDVI
ncbi:hypothetical protein A0H81_10037 [Grifola frondosa]|uniref:PUB domain-containing protein n=1 Tax=Grifola frondosa TaxID=5627 RepID=A0A1C7M553_GRIFR|nr:hypothetical protein A0H81_10037 [Grifola frondosa]